jgi:hypothetical protein
MAAIPEHVATRCLDALLQGTSGTAKPGSDCDLIDIVACQQDKPDTAPSSKKVSRHIQESEQTQHLLDVSRVPHPRQLPPLRTISSGRSGL